MIHEYKNFITIEEQQQAIEFVNNQRERFTHISEYKQYTGATKVPLFFYGSPVYPTQSLNEYSNFRTRSPNLHNFFLLNKCLEKIQTEYGKPIKHFINSSFPGFHIFESRYGLDNSFSIDRYHVDSDMFKYIPVTDVYSFIVVISTTSKGDHLDYMDGNEKKQCVYNERSMYIWKGSIPHKIGDVDLADGGRRITYQGHFLVSDELYYYW